ncbi:TerC family protein [Aurantiacibacter luteus]|uniref:Membrane protein n=1 Tax=Aurantiacibacter luteus TaxID=1581420 RepID=A0A0G9MY52_9SPHN|nr:TerC family protein [Aurantiacibacter luteus]KLE35646.1 membrane protein [Aurantiacibacter luteus]
MDILALLSDPAAWLALGTLIMLEVILGVDNLIFIAILSNKLPVHLQSKARRIGLSLALIMRIGLLMLIGWIVTLQTPLFDLGLVGALNEYGEPSFETAFSGRDLILLAGGLFLLWKATKEIHHSMEPLDNSGDLLDKTPDAGETPDTTSGMAAVAKASFGAVIAQIIAIDLVFSVDSILTAVGMTDEVPIMVAAVVITVGVMMVAADPLSRFIEKNPTLVMLALAFLVMIGLVLIADGLGFHVPKGYIYVAMGFSVGVELLNMVQRNKRLKKAAAAEAV